MRSPSRYVDMCGFLGAFGNLNESLRSKILAYNGLLHRGSDSTDTYCSELFALKFFRLSINGLTPVNNQPYIIGDNVHFINGEIYNYRELSSSRLADTSDTLMAARYLDYTEQLEDLRGMFAGGIFKPSEDRFVLFRDALGIKPAYYALSEDREYLIFASEVKAIKDFVRCHFSPDRAKTFLAHKGIEPEETLYDNICSVEPGHKLEFRCSLKGCLIYSDHHFKDLVSFKDAQQQVDDSSFSCQTRVEDLLVKSLETHTDTCVPYAFQLSGGLDSSILCALERFALGRDLNTFSIEFEEDSEHDESINQRAVANLVKSNHFSLRYTMNMLEEDLEYCTFINDFPIIHPNSLPIYRLACEARKNFKVLISGEGADELFLGYNKYSYVQNEKVLDWAARLSLGGSWTPRLPPLNSIRHLLRGQKDVFSAFCFSRKSSLHEDLFGPIEIRHIERLSSLGNTIRQDDLRFNLFWLLHRYDRLTMASNVEGRVPFCDESLVRYCKSLGTRVHLLHNTKKSLLKKVALHYLPTNIVFQRKKGFSLPIAEWLPNSVYLLSMLEASLTSDTIKGLLDGSRINIEEISSDCIARRYPDLAWDLISLHVYLNKA